MATLSDLLGALISEFTVARVHADLEAVRMAEIYRNTPLLEGAPVPRFRLPELSLDIPIAVKDLPAGGLGPASMVKAPSRQQLVEAVAAAVQASGGNVSSAQQTKIVSALGAQIKQSWGTELSMPRALAASQVLAATAARSVPSVPRGGQRKPAAGADEPQAGMKEVEAFRAALHLHLQRYVIGTADSSPRVEVIARTSELREISDANVVLRMNVRLKEDGFEIVKIDQADGSTTERFVPE